MAHAKPLPLLCVCFPLLPHAPQEVVESLWFHPEINTSTVVPSSVKHDVVDIVFGGDAGSGIGYAVTWGDNTIGTNVSVSSDAGLTWTLATIPDVSSFYPEDAVIISPSTLLMTCSYGIYAADLSAALDPATAQVGLVDLKWKLVLNNYNNMPMNAIVVGRTQ